MTNHPISGKNLTPLGLITILTFLCVITSSLEEDPSVPVQVHNITTTTAVVFWIPLERSSASVVDFTGYKVSLKSDRDISRERLVNTSVDSISFQGLKIFTNYCATVEPQTAFGSLWKEECFNFVTEDSSM